MIIAEVTTFTLGEFTVHARPRPDNPGFAVYLIFRGEALIGKSFSIPDEGTCAWIASGSCYARSSTHVSRYRGKSRGEQRLGSMVPCQQCGQEFYRRRCDDGRGPMPKRLFCGIRCSQDHRSPTRRLLYGVKERT